MNLDNRVISEYKEEVNNETHKKDTEAKLKKFPWPNMVQLSIKLMIARIITS